MHTFYNFAVDTNTKNLKFKTNQLLNDSYFWKQSLKILSHNHYTVLQLKKKCFFAGS